MFHNDVEVRPMRKLTKRQRDAYDHLCQLRQQKDTYWLAVLVRKRKRPYQAVLTGVGLQPDVPRFELTAEEAEAVRQHEEETGARHHEDSDWRRVRGGEYVSTDWKWYVWRRWGRQWFVYHYGDLWGGAGPGVKSATASTSPSKVSRWPR
jgi:hypothetical protein